MSATTSPAEAPDTTGGPPGGDRATAYLDPELGDVSYGRLRAAVARHAARLADLGIPRGRHALVVADDSVATVVGVLASWRVGLVPAVVAPMLTDDEIDFIARDCAAAVLQLDLPIERAAALAPRLGGRPVVDAADVRALARATADGDPSEAGGDVVAGTGVGADLWSFDPVAVDETVLLQYTSGSTGRPKAVRHTARGLAAVARGFGSRLGLTPEDRVLSTAKLSFGYGFGNSLLFPLEAGAAAVLHRGPVDALVLSALIRQHRPTVLMAVPRLYAGLLALARAGRAVDLSSVRTAVSAGEHLPAAMAEEFHERHGLEIVNGLGATEVLHIVSATRPAVDPPGSTGRAVPGVVLTARDESGAPVADGEIGRLHVAGDCVAAGYLNRPQEEARTFADGGAYTGDLVRLRDGSVAYLCRADDVLTVAGMRFAPLEIESRLREVTGVADCAVVAATGALGLQETHAFVVPDPAGDAGDAGGDQLAARVRRHLRTAPPHLRPARLSVVPALPTTSTGKLARFRLRAGSPAGAGPRVERVLLRSGAERKVVMIPYAGGSADAYGELAGCLPDSWGVVSGAVTGSRKEGVDALAEAWWSAVAGDLVPGALLYGHSLGACVALTLAARRAEELRGVAVVLSGLPVTGGKATRAAELSDVELVAWMREHGVLPQLALSDDELIRLVVPGLRRDLAGSHGSWPELRPPGAVHLVTGAADSLCRPEDLRTFSARWPAARVHVVEDADHRLPTRDAAALATVLRAVATEAAVPPPPS